MSYKRQYNQVRLCLWIAERLLWLSKKSQVVIRWVNKQADKWVKKAEECRLNMKGATK